MHSATLRLQPGEFAFEVQLTDKTHTCLEKPGRIRLISRKLIGIDFEFCCHNNRYPKPKTERHSNCNQFQNNVRLIVLKPAISTILGATVNLTRPNYLCCDLLLYNLIRFLFRCSCRYDLIIFKLPLSQ